MHFNQFTKFYYIWLLVDASIKMEKGWKDIKIMTHENSVRFILRNLI